nr:hypothetical protein [uncultured Flavobacterium sp.]
MDLETAFINVKLASRELNANAETHEKLAQSLLLIEQKLFPERFNLKLENTEEPKD